MTKTELKKIYQEKWNVERIYKLDRYVIDFYYNSQKELELSDEELRHYITGDLKIKECIIGNLKLEDMNYQNKLLSDNEFRRKFLEQFNPIKSYTTNDNIDTFILFESKNKEEKIIVLERNVGKSVFRKDNYYYQFNRIK